MPAVTPDLIEACREEYPMRLGRHDLVLVEVDVTDGVVGGTFQLMTWDEPRKAIEGIVEQHVALLRLPDEVAPGSRATSPRSRTERPRASRPRSPTARIPIRPPR